MLIKWSAIGEIGSSRTPLEVEALESASTLEVLGKFQYQYPEYTFCDCTIKKATESYPEAPKGGFGGEAIDALRPD